jgi:hypothetical protein
MAVPLVLSGSVFSKILSVTNHTDAGDGVFARGGNSIDFQGGTGVSGEGGSSTNSFGGYGVVGFGGQSPGFIAGGGVLAFGGSSASNAIGGIGVTAYGGLGDGVGKSGGDGIYASAGLGRGGADNGNAGTFAGNVVVFGVLSSTGPKNFKIDHPLDPENKYLYHASIESSEVLNLYNGNVTLDSAGEAVVKLPDWFQALNKDFRYSLTAIGVPANLYIAEKIAGDRFKIAGGQAGMEVSWQVTGVRNDAHMRKHPMQVEVDKPERERGHYLSPAAFDKAEETGIEWVNRPQLMQELKDKSEQLKQKQTPQP